MATFDQVRKKIAQLPETVKKHAPNIIAETATEYYINSFRDKGWDGVPWTAVKQEPGRGSLMVRSGQLQASIRPSLVTVNEVRISGGSPSVPYAQIHNEGGTITQIPTPKQRKFFWAMEYKTNPNTKVVQVEGSDKMRKELGRWGCMALAKELSANIPQRQFMGKSLILNKQILERLKMLVKQ